MPFSQQGGSGGSSSPGFEIGYDQITADVTVSGTSGAQTTVITCAAHTFDGSAVMVEFFSPQVIPGTNDNILITLFETGAQITILAEVGAATGIPGVACVGRYRFTPTAGSHSYVINAYRVTTNGTIHAVSPYSPSFVRFTKV